MLPDINQLPDFDSLPNQVRSRTSRPGTQPTSAVPPSVQFERPEDGPNGVRFRRIANGYTASAPTRSIPLVVLLSLGQAFVGWLLLHNWNNITVPNSFRIVVSLILVGLLVGTLYFLLGRFQLRLEGNHLVVKNALFGVGFSKTFHVDQLERLAVIRRSGHRWTPRTVGRASDVALRIETHNEQRDLGTNCKAEHLSYFRYLIGLHAKEQRVKGRA